MGLSGTKESTESAVWDLSLKFGGDGGKLGGESGGGGPMVEWLSRSRASVLGVISWSAMGDAVTMVPSVAIGGGWGLLGRNKG